MNGMKTARAIGAVCLAVAGAFVILSVVSKASAHCDSMKGPIIPEARAALEKGDVTPILKWVKEENEAEIKETFAKALVVRTMGDEAKELADRFFLETLIRLHREGEGAPYTGIKDEPVDPINAMADKALVDGSAADMLKKLSSHMVKAIQEKFDKALEAGKNKDKSVKAGREYVESYVAYTHFVEGIHAAIMSAPGHQHESAAGAGSEKAKQGEHKH